MQETWVQSRGREDPLEKRTATHSAILGILAWRIPWTEETGRLQLMGSQSPYWGYPGILWGVVLLNSLLTIVCVWFFLDDFLFFNGPSDLRSLKWNSGSESCSVVSASLQPQGLSPTRLLCLWGFSRQEYQSGLPRPSLGDLPNTGIKPTCPAWQADSLPPRQQGSPNRVFHRAIRHVGSSPTRHQTLIPCTGSTESYPLLFLFCP